MRLVDIHTGKEVKDPSRYEKGINSSLVKKYVLENIDFPLTDQYWNAIDQCFADVWNNKLGIGTYFYWDEVSKTVYEEIQNQKLLMDFERLDRIVTLMLTYVETNGGFLK